MLKEIGCILALQALLVTALPNIFNPTQENVGLDKLTLSWEVRGDTSEDFEYLVTVKEYEQSQNPNIKGIVSEINKAYRKATINELKSGTTYAATIQAVYKDRSLEGGVSTSVVFTTKGVKPPRNLDITTITDTSVTFEWSPPVGQAVDATTIRLIKNEDNKPVLTYPDQPTPLTEYTVNGLEPGSPYIVQIQSKVGKSLSTIVSLGLRTAVGTISRVRMSEITPTSATAHWDAPLSQDQHKISRYEIALIKDASNTNTNTKTEIFSTPTKRPEILTKQFVELIPGRFYGVKVRVVYEKNGMGPWSEVNFFETKIQDKPSAPTKPNVAETSKMSVKINWEAPTNYKGIVDYDIQYAKKDQRPEPLVQTQGAVTEYTITDLESGTTYGTKVRALGTHNIIGLWSTENFFKTEGPRPVSSVSITEITDSSAKVSWTTYTGEEPDSFVVYYKVTDSRDAWTRKDVDKNTSFIKLTSFQPTSPYRIKVHTIKAGIESSPKFQGLRTGINIDITAQQPTHLKLKVVTPSTLEISFNKVANRLVLYYKVEVRGFTIPNIPFIRSEVWPADLGIERQTGTFKDMETGWKYQIRARAIYYNEEEGTWSTPASIIIEGPRPPRFIDIFDIGDTSATVSWKSGYGAGDAEPSNMEYKITLYQLIKADDQKSITTYTASNTETQHKFFNKTKATMRYRIEIITLTPGAPGLAESTPRTLAFRSNSARPTAPILVNVHVSGIEATIMWNRIPNRSDISYYDVHLKKLGVVPESTEQFKTSNGLEESYTFKGLEKSFFYEFKVRGVVNQEEQGKWLIQTFFIPEAAIKKVEDTNVLKKSSNTVTLLWKAGERPDLKMYEIELKSRSRGLTEMVLTEGLTNSFKLEDLHAGTTYTYRVRGVANNENDKGPWSEPQQFTTEAAGVVGSGMSTGVVVGIVLAVIALLILIVVVVMMCRKRKGQNFDRFDGSVKFQKNGVDGGLPAQEMDDTATAIRNGKKLYI